MAAAAKSERAAAAAKDTRTYRRPVPSGIAGVPVYLEPEQLVDILGVSLRYVYGNAEALGGFKIGKVWRFRSDRLPDPDRLPDGK